MEIGRGRLGFDTPMGGGLALALVLAALLAACSRGYAPLPPQPPDRYPLREARGGIQVALDPFIAKERTRDAFSGGEDFPERGLLPVRVLIENRGDAPIRIDPREAVLARAAGQVPSLTPSEAVALVKLPVGWWALGAGFVGGSAQAVRNEGRQRDILARALSEQEVPPGGSATGFLYFARPQSDTDLAGAALALAIQDASGLAAVFEFSLARPDLAAPLPATRAAPAAAPAAASAAPATPGRPGRIEGTGGRGVGWRRIWRPT